MPRPNQSGSSQNSNQLVRPPKHLLPHGWFTKRRISALLADAAICQAFDPSEACLLKAVHYWLNHSRNAHNGRIWSYNTLEAWCGYSGLKIGALRRVINSLKKRNALLTWQPNRRQPTWYSIDYAKLRQIVVTTLKAQGHWPYPECARFDHTQSDRIDHTQPFESYEFDHTQLAECDRIEHAIQETNNTQETSLEQEIQAEQQQTDRVVVSNNSNKTSKTDQPDTLSVEATQKADGIGDASRATGRDQISAGLQTIYQQYLIAFGTEVPDNIKVKMQSAELSTCQDALNATLERQKDGSLTNPPGFLCNAIQQTWKPTRRPNRGATLSKLLKELNWNALLTDKEWPDRPDEAITVSDLNESGQLAYEDFLHQRIKMRNQRAAGLIEEIRSEWQRLGYDGGPNESIEQSWRTHQFKSLADVPREVDDARAYLENLRTRPTKRNTQTAVSPPTDPTPQIPKTRSAPPPNGHSNSKSAVGKDSHVRGGMSSLGKILLASGIQDAD